jgi:hypothetical protein
LIVFAALLLGFLFIPPVLMVDGALEEDVSMLSRCLLERVVLKLKEAMGILVHSLVIKDCNNNRYKGALINYWKALSLF